MNDEAHDVNSHRNEPLIRLMILDLLYKGVKQGHIAAMLGVSDATVSRMIPKGLAAEIRDARKKA